MPQGLSLSDFRAVLFDVDGTLADSLEMIVLGLGDTIEKYLGRRPSHSEIRRNIGLPLPKQLPLYGSEDLPAETIQAMNDHAVERFRFHESHERMFQPAVEALRLSHAAGLRTALVTSKSDVELAAFLQRFDGTPFVDATVCSSDVSSPKPNPESALLACERLGVRPCDAAFIGDSVYDMRCARNAGLACVAVAYGAAPREVLLGENPEIILDTPEALFEWAESAFLQTSCPARS